MGYLHLTLRLNMWQVLWWPTRTKYSIIMSFMVSYDPTATPPSLPSGLSHALFSLQAVNILLSSQRVYTFHNKFEVAETNDVSTYEEKWQRISHFDQTVNNIMFNFMWYCEISRDLLPMESVLSTALIYYHWSICKSVCLLRMISCGTHFELGWPQKLSCNIHQIIILGYFL